MTNTVDSDAPHEPDRPPATTGDEDTLVSSFPPIGTDPTRPTPMVEPPPGQGRRWPLWLVGGGAAACLLGMVCLGLFFVFGGNDEATPAAVAVASPSPRREASPTPRPTPSPTATSPSPTATPETEAAGPAAASALPFQATVQIWALQRDGDDWLQLWNGSGSIVTADGYILTNAHVVLPDKNYDVDGLMVSLTLDSDQPPTPAYLAEIVVVDPDLDLAVIRVTSDLEGNPVDYAALDLPVVRLGDSDDLELGTPLRILGYPGIGGETITLTSGEVAGFVSEPGVKGRAFIKTSATIAGGNSGGMAIDTNGFLIGVPTQLGYGGNDQFVDCRVLADTNGDGSIDDQDGCIPTGGFINALRPINLAKPFIADAIAGLVQRPPTPEPERPQVEVPANAGQVLFFDDFSDPASGWSTFSDDEVSSRYEEGRLVIDVDVQETAAWAILDQEFEEVDFEVETVKLGGPDDNAFGLMLHYQDADNFYVFEISSDGFYKASVLENDELRTLIEWTKTYLVDPGGKNTLAVEAQPGQFTIFINGVQVDQVSDDTFSRGRVGLAARTLSEPDVSIGFDNARLRVPGGEREVTVVPGAGIAGTRDLIYSDDFSTDSGDWFTGPSDDSLYGFENDEYFIEVSREQLEVWSTLSLAARDVTVEVEARKVHGADLNSFGVLCRYVDAENFYALEIGSDGTYAIRKAFNGEFTSLVDWTSSEAIRQGQAWNRLRAACVGHELSLWANDVLLASTSDDDLSQGDIALSLGTFDEAGVRVHFDNLAVFAPASAPAVEAGSLLLEDDFSDEATGWPTGEETASRFFYDDGEYYIEVFKDNFTAWASSGESWSDVRIDVDARQAGGPDDNQYGLYCRYLDRDNYYEINISGDGYYSFYLQHEGEIKTLIKWTATQAINQGQDSNHLTVLCEGDRLALWVNGEFIDEVFDDTLSEGEISLVAGTYDEANVLIAFDNLQVSKP
ncbi:MAG: trypsin-like peptidase domain-containing protein [Anaerolineae bacterium]